MFLNRAQSTPPVLDLSQPTKTTDPTLQCVVLTGIPIFDAISTVIAEPISIVKPLHKLESCSQTELYRKTDRIEYYLDGVILVKSSPIVLITLLPQTQRPIEMPTPPKISNQIGVAASDSILPSLYTKYSAISGPMAFETSALVNIKINYIKYNKLVW